MTKVIFNRETHSPERLNIKAKDFISYKQNGYWPLLDFNHTKKE